MDEQKQILKLAAEIANTDLQTLEQGWRRRLQIMDSQIQSLRQLEGEYRNKLAEMATAIDHLRALYKINMKILGIVNAPASAPQNRNREHGKITVNLTRRGERVSAPLSEAKRR